MPDVNVPYLDVGRASFEELDNFVTEFVLMGDTPRLQTYPMPLAASQTIAQFEVLSRNPAGHLVPATYSPATHASLALTFSNTGTAADTITVAGVIYTLRAAVTTTANEVLVGATAAATAANLAAAINGTAGSGTTYGSLTVANPNCYATVAAAVVTIWARVPGLEGNGIAVAEASTHAAFAGGATALAGGSGGAAAEFIATQAVTSSAVAGETTVPVFYAGNFNIDALVWHPSFSTDAMKLAAFRGAPSPTQIVVAKRNT